MENEADMSRKQIFDLKGAAHIVYHVLLADDVVAFVSLQSRNRNSDNDYYNNGLACQAQNNALCSGNDAIENNSKPCEL